MITGLKARLDGLPIRRKLLAITVVSTLVPMLGGFAFVVQDRLTDLRDREVSQAVLAARIAADYSVAPVSFADPQGARERLAYLETIPNAVRAEIIDPGGELFARWHRQGGSAADPPRLRSEPFSLLRPTYTVSQPVVRDERRIGTLLLQAGTGEVREELHRYLVLLVLVLALVLLASVALAGWLQRYISGPILALAAVTRNISKREDYGRRVHRDAADEIGDLYRGFNTMLSRVQEHQSERERIHARLAAAYDDLERRVEERTLELRQLNLALESEVAERAGAERRISRALEEKEILLREIHHRVKNNLQVVYSLLSLQAHDCTDPEIKGLLEDSRQRVKTMALVHETLYDSPELSRVSAPEFIRRITDNMMSVFHSREDDSRIEVDVEAFELSLDQAVPAGLIINELVTNSIKYAYPDSRSGSVKVELSRPAPGLAELRVRDWGVGLPEGLEVHKTDTLGLKLVSALTVQLQGELEVERVGGVGFRIRFPLEEGT